MVLRLGPQVLEDDLLHEALHQVPVLHDPMTDRPLLAHRFIRPQHVRYTCSTTLSSTMFSAFWLNFPPSQLLQPSIFMWDRWTVKPQRLNIWTAVQQRSLFPLINLQKCCSCGCCCTRGATEQMFHSSSLQFFVAQPLFHHEIWQEVLC